MQADASQMLFSPTVISSSEMFYTLGASSVMISYIQPLLRLCQMCVAKRLRTCWDKVRYGLPCGWWWWRQRWWWRVSAGLRSGLGGWDSFLLQASSAGVPLLRSPPQQPCPVGVRPFTAALSEKRVAERALWHAGQDPSIYKRNLRSFVTIPKYTHARTWTLCIRTCAATHQQQRFIYCFLCVIFSRAEPKRKHHQPERL